MPNQHVVVVVVLLYKVLVTSKKRITDEYRKKQSDGAKGNTNVKGYKWWTNGEINKRSKSCPGERFYLGTKKRL